MNREPTVIIVALNELEKGPQYNNNARDSAQTHGDGEADLFPLLQLQIP